MASIGSVRRCADDRKVSGLAAGLARSWNVDPVLVRVAFAILALSGGIGILLYLAGWAMIPQEGRDTSHLDEAIPQTRRWPKELRVAIVIVVCLIGAGILSSLAPFTLVAAVVLAAVWYFGHYKGRRRQQPGSDRLADPAVGAPSGPGGADAAQQQTEFFDYRESTPFTEAATAWQRRIVAEQRAAGQAEQERRSAPPRQPSAAPGSASPNRPVADEPPPLDERRAAFLADPDPVGLYSPPAATEQTSAVDLVAERKLQRRRTARRLGLITVVVFGLTMTGLGIASALGAAIGAATYLAATLLVIGLSLLAGTRYGRPPGMVLAAVLVAFALLASLAVSPGATGYREIRYTDAAGMTTDELGTGQLTVDLRDLQLEEPHQYTAEVGTGRLEVLLPEDVPVRITGSVHQGLLMVDGQENRVGQQLEFSQPPPAGANGPLLTIDLSVGQGQLEVRR